MYVCGHRLQRRCVSQILSSMDDDIAVVGIGCKFPGANNIEEFWRVLVNEENHVVDIPAERWNNDAFYSDDQEEPDKIYIKKAAFINGFDEWDSKLFGISDYEAEQMDPQQRLVLDCTHMALEDAGITRKQLNGSQAGVYLGVMGADYKTLFEFDHSEDTNYTATGASNTIIASRVSYVYNLQGPCMVIDTACSSSIVALHLGSQAIRTGDCDMAICGGVSLMLTPGIFQTLCRAKMLSSTCQCQAFCDTADGYARGEGCGIVILKSYSKAVREGNKIWGIVKTGTNQDGHTATPITAPSGEQQEKLLNKLYSQCNVDPTTLQYIECHGTGTKVGDPTEVNAIGRFIDSYRKKKKNIDDNIHCQNKIATVNQILNSRDETVYDVESEEIIRHNVDTTGNDDKQRQERILIGSVKTNIGHLESAAGVAGLIKVLLMMENGKFVPSLHVHKDKSNLNRNINFDEYGLDVALAVNEWNPNWNCERTACINSFGFGGSNSHVIVLQKRNNKSAKKHVSEDRHALICVSALNKQALKVAMEALDKDLSTGKYNLQDVSYTSIFHRDHHTCRTLVFGKNLEGVRDNLKQRCHLMNNLEKTNRLRLIFVFSGVGTTWTGMCKEMMETQPAFRNAVSMIDDILKPLTGWTVTDKFERVTDYSDPLLNHISLFCMQVALFKMWECFGIFPDSIIGQSVGEVAAAFASGALTLADAVNVIYTRSKVLSYINGGKMMVVGNYELSKIEQLCQKYNNQVEIAVYNSPYSCTLSGDSGAIECIKKDLQTTAEKENSGVLLKVLNVPCAYHSHYVDPCIDQIETLLKPLDHDKTLRRIEHYSTVTGKLAVSEEFKTGQYWSQNIRKPVKLMQSVENAALDDAMNVFLEIGPSQVLHAHLDNVLTGKQKGMCIPSMRKNKEIESFFASLSTLFELGASVRLENASVSGNLAPIPRYIPSTVKMLHIPSKHKAMLNGYMNFTDRHMFVRQTGSSKSSFQMRLERRTTPFIYEHLFSNTCIVPGATYLEAAIEVGIRTLNINAYELSISAEFVSTLQAETGITHVVDINVTEDPLNKACSYEVMQGEHLLCRGNIKGRTQGEMERLDMHIVKSRCDTYKTQTECYKYLEKMYFSYGDSFRIIKQAWSSSLECLAEFELPEVIKNQSKQLNIHPNIIDGLFQMVVVLHHKAIDNFDGDPSPFFPKEVGSLVLNRPCKSRMFAYTRLVEKVPTGHIYNFLIVDSAGHVIAEVQDFFSRKMDDSEANARSKYYDILWQEADLCKNDSHDTQPVNDRPLLVIGSDRFLEYFKQGNESNTSYISLHNDKEVRRDMIHDFQNLKAVIFAPLHHVNELQSDSSSLYAISKQTILSLIHIIKMLKEKRCECPLFVLTENVVSAPLLHISASNVCGAELWGMVRSAVSENVYNDIRLVDMVLTGENIIALREILENKSDCYIECLINRAKVYFSEVVEVTVGDKMCLQRETERHFNDDVKLKSERHDCLQKCWYELHSKDDEQQEQSNEYMRLRLKMMCLHDSDLYPVSSCNDEDNYNIWPKRGSGFQALCIEGVGWINNENEKNNITKKEYVFCCPVDVTTDVHVPRLCVYDIGKLREYTPGMLTEAVILFNMLEACRKIDCVSIITDKGTDIWNALIHHIFAHLGASRVTIKSKDHLSKPVRDGTSDSQVVVVLASMTGKHLEMLPLYFPQVKQIISVDRFLPRHSQIWIETHVTEHPVDILRIDRMFHKSALMKSLPKIFGILKLFELDEYVTKQEMNSDKNDGQTRNSFSLPHLSFRLQDQEESSKLIPLKVYQSEIFRPNACYIIVGGLTGLGWEVTKYMAELGAGYIATISRRLPSNEQRLKIDDIEDKQKCKIIPLQGDITDIGSLQKAFASLQSQIIDVPVKGIFQGAGTICDVMMENMSEKDLDSSLLPKVLGTWNLHFLTLHMPLDFFVMHSSIVSVLGNQGQCNYAAGNSFLDSFAHYRRHLGLCGQSINWSALSVGMATHDKKLEVFLQNKGIHLLSTIDIRSCFIRAVMENKSQVIFGQIDWRKLIQDSSININEHKFSRIIKKTERQPTERSTRTHDFDTIPNPQEKRNLTMDVIKSEVARTFVLDDSTLSADSSFASLGIDSMVAISFINSMHQITGVRIPTGFMFSAIGSVRTVTDYVMQRIGKGSSVVKGTEDTKDVKDEILALQGNITFMQKSVLMDYEKDPYSPDLLRQAAWEITDMHTSISLWKKVLKYLLKMHPDLRRIYKRQVDGSYRSQILKADSVEIIIEEIDYNSKDFSEDCRENVFIDISKEVPIRFRIAHLKDKTRFLMFTHAIVTDLFGIGTLIQGIGQCIENILSETGITHHVTFVEPNEIIRSALKPIMSDLKQFWNNMMSQDIQPFTFGGAYRKDLDRTYWREISTYIPENVVEMIRDFTYKEEVTFYNFVTSVYMLVLHERIGCKLIPLITNADMRSHVPQLRSVITRCANEIPILGDLRNVKTVREYLKANSANLLEITKHSAYPYQLIEREFQTEELKKYIGRHRIIMNNMTPLTKAVKKIGVNMANKHFFYKRHTYETALSVVYDTEEKIISFQFGYNSDVLNPETAAQLSNRLVALLQIFIDFPESSLHEVQQRRFLALDTCFANAIITEGFEKCSSVDHATMETAPELMKQSTQIKINKQEERQELLRFNIDSFVKLAEKGREHPVQLRLFKNSSCFVLTWRVLNDVQEHELQVQTKDVTFKEINGEFHIQFKVSGESVEFKTGSRDKATTLMSALTKLP